MRSTAPRSPRASKASSWPSSTTAAGRSWWFSTIVSAFYPTYIARDRERLLVAPEAKAILAAPGFVKRLDLTALAQFIRFQVVLGDRTFFEGISLLPPATVCRCDLRTGSVTLNRYWEFGAFDLLPEPPLAEMAEECARLLSRAVNRAVHGPERALHAAPAAFTAGFCWLVRRRGMPRLVPVPEAPRKLGPTDATIGVGAGGRG
jgi:hypothetical protein